MRRPQLIATDLDGTFLGADGMPSKANVEAMAHAHELGIKIVVATGRPARWLDVLEPIRGVRPEVIASNGGVIYDLAEDRVIQHFPVPPLPALCTARAMREVCPEVTFAVELPVGWAREAEYPVRGDFIEADRICPVEDLVEEPFVKLLAISQKRSGDQMAELLSSVVDEELTMTWSMPGPIGMLEISARGVTKAHSLQILCDEHGIDPADAVAFGDMPNDLEMLRLVGRGYCMDDAHPLLMAEGFACAGRHDESGVGRTIESLLRS